MSFSTYYYIRSVTEYSIDEGEGAGGDKRGGEGEVKLQVLSSSKSQVATNGRATLDERRKCYCRDSCNRKQKTKDQKAAEFQFNKRNQKAESTHLDRFRAASVQSFS